MNGPSGDVESRIATRLARKATSTQFSDSHCLLLRQRVGPSATANLPLRGLVRAGHDGTAPHSRFYQMFHGEASTERRRYMNE
jgi:hypothetical protein